MPSPLPARAASARQAMLFTVDGDDALAGIAIPDAPDDFELEAAQAAQLPEEEGFGANDNFEVYFQEEPEELRAPKMRRSLDGGEEAMSGEEEEDDGAGVGIGGGGKRQRVSDASSAGLGMAGGMEDDEESWREQGREGSAAGVGLLDEDEGFGAGRLTTGRRLRAAGSFQPMPEMMAMRA